MLLLVSGACYGQQEFPVYPNGLIYNEATMAQLGAIVDSLNLKFKTCDLSHPYFSLPQGWASVVKVPGKEARNRIANGISFAEYKRLHPSSVREKALYVVKARYTDYDGKQRIEYSGLPYGWNSATSITVKANGKNDKTTGWILTEKGDMAMYLEKLEQIELPFDYARLVQYVDCMIDTTASVFFPSAQASLFQTVKPSGAKAYEFQQWADGYPGQPKLPAYKELEKQNLEWNAAYETYYKEYKIWDSLRLNWLDAQMSRSAYWKSVLMEAVEEGVENGNSDAKLEFYVARYLSKTDALKLMRSRRVMGTCSMDQSPRYHAMSICQLAAETAQWDIFLRSHLDIMNDRFQRMSDGSYAWAGRQTYLKELEELDIHAIDLLLGISLRVENVSSNHYLGSINRVGRALADAANKDELENRMLTMMQDNKLDVYNRLLMAYLYGNYSYNLADEHRKKARLEQLEEVVTKMPEPVREVWKRQK